jgi:Fic family protein
MIKKILTFKSGKFVFSSQYSTEVLLSLQIESNILYKTVSELPMLPRIASQLQEDLIKRSIFSTAALEGNPLSQEKVSEIIDNKDNIQDTEKSKKEIRNLSNAYKIIRGLKKTGSNIIIDEQLIKDIHRAITHNIKYAENNPGNYRNHVVKVGNSQHGGIYMPPKIVEDIQTLMSEFISWVNDENIKKLNPVIRAAFAHFYLGLIHPFGDGNGRTARIVEAYILQLSDMKYVPAMLSNYYYKNIDDYYWAFSKSIKNKENDITPFLEFVLKGVIESLKEIKDIITYHIRVLTLKDYFHFLRIEKSITLRQYDLVILLLEKPFFKFLLKDLFQISPFNVLYRNVSPSTARRDLKKLLDRKILTINDQGEFELNYSMLD